MLSAWTSLAAIASAAIALLAAVIAGYQAKIARDQRDSARDSAELARKSAGIAQQSLNLAQTQDEELRQDRDRTRRQETIAKLDELRQAARDAVIAARDIVHAIDTLDRLGDDAYRTFLEAVIAFQESHISSASTIKDTEVFDGHLALIELLAEYQELVKPLLINVDSIDRARRDQIRRLQEKIEQLHDTSAENSSKYMMKSVSIADSPNQSKDSS